MHYLCTMGFCTVFDPIVLVSWGRGQFTRWLHWLWMEEMEISMECGRFTLSYTGEQYCGTKILQKLPYPYFLKENLCIEWWKDSQQNLVRSLTGCRWPHWRSVGQMSGGSAADCRWLRCWLVENFYPSCNIFYCQQTFQRLAAYSWPIVSRQWPWVDRRIMLTGNFSALSPRQWQY